MPDSVACEALCRASWRATDEVKRMTPQTSASWLALARHLLNSHEAEMHLPAAVAAIEGHGVALAREVMP